MYERGVFTLTKQNPVFDKKLREQNALAVSEAMQKLKGMDFNDVIYAFADIIHSTFLNSLNIGKSKEEREAQSEDIIKLHNEMIDVLNAHSKNSMNDVIVFSSLIMTAVENAAQLALEDSNAINE